MGDPLHLHVAVDQVGERRTRWWRGDCPLPGVGCDLEELVCAMVVGVEPHRPVQGRVRHSLQRRRVVEKPLHVRHHVLGQDLVLSPLLEEHLHSGEPVGQQHRSRPDGLEDPHRDRKMTGAAFVDDDPGVAIEIGHLLCRNLLPESESIMRKRRIELADQLLTSPVRAPGPDLGAHHRHVVSAVDQKSTGVEKLGGDPERKAMHRRRKPICEMPGVRHEDGVGAITVGEAVVGMKVVLAVVEPEQDGGIGLTTNIQSGVRALPRIRRSQYWGRWK